MTEILIKNPKLKLIEYYDSLIRQVDIYTEEQLAKYTSNENIVELHGELDLFNRKRDELIDELRKHQKEELIERKWRLKESNKFMLLFLSLKPKPYCDKWANKRSPFKLFLLVLDFSLNTHEQELLRFFI